MKTHTADLVEFTSLTKLYMFADAASRSFFFVMDNGFPNTAALGAYVLIFTGDSRMLRAS